MTTLYKVGAFVLHRDNPDSYIGQIKEVTKMGSKLKVVVCWYDIYTGEITNHCATYFGLLSLIILTDPVYKDHYHQSLRKLFYPSFTGDSKVVQKIKELDYRWEIRMKAKGRFFLTSRVLNVGQEITSQSTQTDTATVSDVGITPWPREPHQYSITEAYNFLSFGLQRNSIT